MSHTNDMLIAVLPRKSIYHIQASDILTFLHYRQGDEISICKLVENRNETVVNDYITKLYMYVCIQDRNTQVHVI